MSASAASQTATDSRLVIPARFVGAPANRRRLHFVIGGVLLIGGATSWLLAGHSKSSTYRTEPVSRRTIVRRIEAIGHLDVPQRIEIAAPAPGRIARILVESGQAVHAGDLLAQLDEAVAALALGAARDSLKVGGRRIEQARTALDAATDARSRIERLAARGLASDADLQNARADETRARSALGVAQAEERVSANAVSAAALQKRLTSMRSPIDGIVLAAPVRVGAATSPEAAPLFVLGTTMAAMRLEVSVAEGDIADVRPGQSARFTVPAFPGRTFDAVVSHVDPEAQRERTSVTYTVTLDAPNPARLLLPGMTANVQIEVARAVDVLAVREAALRFAPALAAAPTEVARSRLWRVHGRRLDAVGVVTGTSDGAYTEVRPRDGETLRPGDSIAIGTAFGEAARTGGPGISLGRR